MTNPAPERHPHIAPKVAYPIHGDIECAVLCVALADKEACAATLSIIPNADNFASAAHRKIFAAIARLASMGTTVDPLTVADELDRRGELEVAGGKNYLARLVDEVPRIEGAGDYARSLVDRAQRLALQAHYRRAADDASERIVDLPTHVRESEARAHAIVERHALIKSPFLTADEVQDLPPREFLVDGLIPLGGVTEVHGPPSAGKSFFTFGMACAVASGYPFLNRAVKRGRVIYVAGEGKVGLGARLRAWRAANSDGDLSQLHILPEPVQLLDPAHVARFLG